MSLGLPQPAVQVFALGGKVVGQDPDGALLEAEHVEKGLDVTASTAWTSHLAKRSRW
ncbi:hypothetical protein LRE75_17465 [Streptomyces sp. 372A]